MTIVLHSFAIALGDGLGRDSRHPNGFSVAEGFNFIASGIVSARFDHAAHWKSFYAHGTWWVAAHDGTGNDYFLYEWDGTYPANTGDAGGWAKALGTDGAGTVNLDQQNSARIALWYDAADTSLHALAMAPSPTESRYSKWLYQAGTNSWTTTGAGVPQESMGAATGTNGAAIVVDSNGVVWVPHYNGAVYKMRYRSGGAWADAPDIGTSEATLDMVVAAGKWMDGDGDPAIYMFYWLRIDSVNSLRFATRKDSASLTAEWTKELARTGSVDGHMSTQSYVASAETTSTIAIAHKDTGSHTIYCTVRLPNGTWVSSSGIFAEDRTRARVTIDPATDRVLVTASQGGSNNQILQAAATIADPLSFGTAYSVLTTTEAFNNDCATGQQILNADAGFLVMSEAGTNKVWWNVLTPAQLGTGV